MTTSVEQAVAACRPTEIEPVELSAESLDSTAPEYLRELKRELAENGFQPARLTIEGCFDEDCSLATQEEADRLRGFVRAASFLGAGDFTVTIDEIGDAEKVRPALSALEERAHREGVTLTVEGLELPA